MLKVFFIPLATAVVGCSTQPNMLNTCSKVQAISLPDSGVYGDIESGKLPAGWGGVLDLIQDTSQLDSSPRHRCTVHMDLVITADGSHEEQEELALWTADHCLKFSEADGADLYLFDTSKKTYLRLKVEIPELERFKRGLLLFQARLSASSTGDTEAQSDLNTFLKAGNRPSVLLNGEPLIERGASLCKSDTATYKASTQGTTVTCSSVLDLARLSVLVSDESMRQHDVVDALNRMKSDLRKLNDRRFELIEKITNQQDRTGQEFFIRNWRPKVTALTRWRRYEAESALIEKVRLCEPGEHSGICAQEFRNFFSDALSDYTTKWGVSAGQNFQSALKNEVYSEPLPTTNAKHNLKWLLSTQAGLGKGMENNPLLLSDVKFSTNFSRQTEVPDHLDNLPVLGSVGGLYYGLASPFTMYTSKPAEVPIKINSKTILLSHLGSLETEKTFFLQPGDSGSLFLLGGLPLAVVATVDGKETSGGTAVLPLPTIADDAVEPLPNEPVVTCK